MFLEKLGKFCFLKTRFFLIPFYTAILLPVLFVGTYLLVQHTALQRFEETFSAIKKKEGAAIERKKRKDRLIQRHSGADPLFLDRFIESVTFLQKECAELDGWTRHPVVACKKSLEDRVKFLTGNSNRLAFSEEAIRSSADVKETEEKQRFPVQMNGDDLQKLCASLEDIPVGDYQPLAKMPQIIIEEIRIKKLDNAFHVGICEVEMLLLKREWVN